ncbi:MAG: hypothetical protein IJ715_00800 [Bacilli bacterium]|nr:hypothetical protein [Bacilli bacterium]
MKNFKNILIISFLLFILLQIFINISKIHEIIFFSYKIFIDNIVPNLFPFLVISNILVNYGFVDIISKLFNPIMKKVFNIDGAASFVFFMSFLTGFPSNAKYTKDLLTKNLISSTSATKILTFTHFSNPLFIIGNVSLLISKKAAYTILFAHFLGNVLIGLLFRNCYIEKANCNLDKKSKLLFGEALSNSVKGTIDTLLLIYGTMTFFLIISCILSSILNLNQLNNCLMSGIMEFTQGIKYTSLLNIDYKFKTVLIGMFISFGGLSVHAQILSIIANTNILYKPFFLARIIHSFITGFIIYLII